jgi:hypothetical protein
MGFLDRAKQAREQAAEAMGSMGGMKGMMGQAMPGGGGDMSAQMAHAQLVNKLGKVGVEAPGTLNALRPTGQTDMGGGQQNQADVTVTPAGGAPYTTTVTQSFLPAQLETLAVGAAITVKYDPDDPSAAIITSW